MEPRTPQLDTHEYLATVDAWLELEQRRIARRRALRWVPSLAPRRHHRNGGDVVTARQARSRALALAIVGCAFLTVALIALALDPPGPTRAELDVEYGTSPRAVPG